MIRYKQERMKLGEQLRELSIMGSKNRVFITMLGALHIIEVIAILYLLSMVLLDP